VKLDRKVILMVTFLTAFSLLTSTLSPPSHTHASTIAISTGDSTIDGRPVAWKNRDHWSTPDGWKVYPFQYEADASSFGSGDQYKSRFDYVGITAHGDSGIDTHTQQQVPWVGINEKGLGLVQGAGHTLTSSFTQDHGFPVSQDLNNGMLAGFFNHVVLSRAEHIDEVEQILIDTNDGGGFNQSFARNTSTMISVFDRWGNAATFEIDGDSYARSNVTEEYQQDANGYFSDIHTDDKGTTYPNDGEYSGYDWRANLSLIDFTKPNGFPYFVDDHITEVDDSGNITNSGELSDGIHDWAWSSSAINRHFRTGLRMDDPHLISYRDFMQNDVGSYAIGDKWSMKTLSRNIGYMPRDEKPTGFHLNRFVSTFGAVLNGSKIGDPYEGKLGTMWAAYGEPAVGVFVPIFPYTGEVPDVLLDMYEEVNNKRHQVYDYNDDSACGYSCGRNIDHTIDTYALTGEYYGESGIMKYVFDIENWMFEQYDLFMTDLRNGTRNEVELKEDMIEWQTNLAHQVNEYYVNEVSIFPAVENAYVRQSAPDSTFNDSLRVGQDSVISYLKFDLGGITGKPIKSVKVRLTESSSNGTGNTNFEVTKTIEDWNEDSVTCETKPETDGHVYGAYSGGQLEESEVIEIDLPLDSGFLATDGIYEIALIGLGGSVENEFALKDTLDGAKMIVEYDNLNDIIVDNKRMTADSSWWNSTAEPNYNEFNYYYRRTSSSESKGRWTPYITNPGMYEVYYWLPDGTPNRTTQAPYTIQHADGAETFYVDQTVAGGEWIQLGDEAFPFEAGLNGYVEISNIANGEIVIADSIRFIKVDE
jgi:hypothetical protein